jgi:hypothetical protein
MALIKSTKTNEETDQVSDQAYHRIHRISWTMRPLAGLIEVRSYHNKQAFIDNKNAILPPRNYTVEGQPLQLIIAGPITSAEAGVIPFTPYGIIYTRLYNYLKGLPDFEGATDD